MSTFQSFTGTHNSHDHILPFSIEVGYYTMLYYPFRYFSVEEVLSWPLPFLSKPNRSIKMALQPSFLQTTPPFKQCSQTMLTNRTFSPDARNACCILERINKSLASSDDTLGRTADDQTHAGEFHTPAARR